MKRDDLTDFFGELFSEQFDDIALNGLQVRGKDQINKIICGVSLNCQLIDAAIEQKADAIFVHHGIFWGKVAALDGWLYHRVKKLFDHDINLYAYHLPLDAHPKYGNNVGLAQVLKINNNLQKFGRYKNNFIGLYGELANYIPLQEFINSIEVSIGKANFILGPAKKQIKKIAICSGGATELFLEAVEKKADLYLTGEATEWVNSIAQESNICFIAAGHHQTEVFGVKSIANLLQSKLNVKSQFINIPNIV